MVDLEDFPVALAESDAIEPMMQIPPELPVLPLRDIVIYPFMIVPLFVSRDRSIRAVEEALKNDRMILLVSQKDVNKEEPEQDDLYKVGTVAIIMRMLKLPDGRIRILIQGLSRCLVDSVSGTGEYVNAGVTPISEPLAPENSLEVEALVRNVRGSMERAASLGKNISPEVLAIIANLDDAGRLADLSASNLELKVEDAQTVLDIANPVPRLRRVNDLLSREIDVLTVQQEINTQARSDIDRSQREYFLRQQLKAIQGELGEGNELYEEIEQYRDKILKAKMPENAEEESLRQLKKLERMHPDTAETATLRNWLDIMTDLPWSNASKDNLNLKKAEKILNDDHYGLERVKERIIESLAVRKLREKPKGSILCLVGPPGVGKTSLGRSVARALNRKFMRLSLGGLHDEAEIRGHRRTYVGAMPGRIIQAIQGELGEGKELYEEIEQYRDKILKVKMPENAEEESLRQLKKLERMHPDTAETATLRNWLDIMTDLPWSKASKDNLNLKKAEKILNDDHYGLERVKERIIESLAVRKLREKPKGSILCLVGPPGVGKTSLGRSVARALNRKFMRLSLGGLHDEAEIRGHRRTYVGAMPGRIIQAIQQAGTNNPLIMLDEIDKVGADFRGDPSSALLEVLDPEQNSSFRDNYLGVTFDLSNVMFMTTANMLDTVQAALRDRMETISLSGYTEEEKLEIAKRHLIPKQIEENGLAKDDIKFERKALAKMISEYTQEAGLRQLEREIGKVCRKAARSKAELDGKFTQMRVTTDNLKDFLRVPKIFNEGALKKDEIGTATGLAWTAVGGDILFIEALKTKGKGKLLLTGQLGEVMQESAQAAFSYAKARSADLGIDESVLENYDIHIHLPEGAIPKDGPSAGITMATALVSVLSQRPVRKDVAMTGEITLRGNVLPVGGVKEKLLAARRAKIKTVILPEPNERDLEDLPQEVRDDLTFIFVENVQQVFDAALRESKLTVEKPKARALKAA